MFALTATGRPTPRANAHGLPVGALRSQLQTPAHPQQNRSQPFFVYLPSNLIHTPLQVAPELAAEFDALGLGDSTRKVYWMIHSVDNNLGRLRIAQKVADAVSGLDHLGGGTVFGASVMSSSCSALTTQSRSSNTFR